MKIFSILSTLFIFPLFFLSLYQSATAEPSDEPHNSTDTPEVCLGENLLENPSFEGEYSAYDPPEGHDDCIHGPCNSAQMADGWTPYWRSHDLADPGHIIRMPEYKPDILAEHHTGPIRTRSGERAQQYFSFFSTHEAGFYQQISGVAPGVEYCFSGWGHSWSAQDDGDALSGPEDGILRQKVGIDPTGGTDWTSPNIIWSDAAYSNGRVQYDVFDLFSISAVAQADTITVFTYSQPEFGVKHNNVYWDDARLTAAAQLNITPTAGLSFLTTPTDTVQISQTISISYTGANTLTWSAAISPTNTLTPTLSAASGNAGDPLVISLDSTGLPLGSYTATIVITTDPPLAGSPVHLDYAIIVVPEVKKAYLPIALKN